jgi:hypothetical protein
MQEAHVLQPASCYPYREEPDLIDFLEDAGFAQASGPEDDSSLPFGPGTAAPEMFAYRLRHVGEGLKHLYQLEGAALAIKQAQVSMQTL